MTPPLPVCRALALISWLAACGPPTRPVGSPGCLAMRAPGEFHFAVGPDATLSVGSGRTITQRRSTGGSIWQVSIQAPGSIESIAVDSHADVIVTGEGTPAELDPDLDPGADGAARPGCFVEKRRGRDGQLAWSVPFVATGTQYCRALAVDASGDVYVAGYFQGELRGEKAATLDIAVMRLAGSDGSLRWLRRFGGTGVDIARAIAIDNGTGTVLVGGSFSGDVSPQAGGFEIGSTRLRSAGDHDALLFALTREGATLWATRFGDVGFDLVKSIAVDVDGSAYVAGARMRPADYGGEVPFHAGTMDGYLAKYTRTGTVVWRRIYAGGEGSQAHRVMLAGRTVIVVGHFKRQVDLGGRSLQGAPRDLVPTSPGSRPAASRSGPASSTTRRRRSGMTLRSRRMVGS